MTRLSSLYGFSTFCGTNSYWNPSTKARSRLSSDKQCQHTI